MTANERSEEFVEVDAGDIGLGLGPAATLNHVSTDPIDAITAATGESKVNGHAGGTHPAARESADRYEPFPLNDLQRAYIVGRNPSIPLGGTGCHLYLEFSPRDLDPIRFERAWNTLIRTNEVMRVVIDAADHQRILRDVPWVRVTVTRLAGFEPLKTAAALAAVRETMSQRVHDVAEWPLHEVRMAILPDGLARVFMKFDLAGIDAASVFRLSARLQHAYETASHEEDWSPPATGYREDRIAEENRRGGAIWQRDREFWRGLVPSLPEAPQLPYAAQFHDLTPPRFQRFARGIDYATVHRLEARAAAHGLSLPKVINAAFAEIIAAWSSDRHFLLNLPIFLRPKGSASSESMLGNYTSNVLIAADMRAGSFTDRARGLWRNLARALRHRSYSGVNVLQDLRRLRGDPLQPIAPVVLTNVLAHRTAQNVWYPDSAHSVTYTPQVVLDHQVMSAADALMFHWDAVAGAFQPGVVEAMADAHVSLLERLASDDAPWREPALSVLGPAQRAVRAQMNATARSLDHGLLHDGFFARAQESPDSAALVEGDRVVSFAELAALAEKVRARVAESGVERGDAVACAMSYGIGLAAVALGTLAHGAVYAPLDPTSPPHRRRREIDILKPRAAFVDDTSRASFSAFDRPILDMRSIAHAPRLDAPASPRVTPDDRAYMIFTSGTTGDPKAIVIRHRGVANTCADLVERFSIGPLDRVLGLSAPTFDLSVFDMFGLWAAGSCVVVPDARRRLDPAAWVEAIDAHGVTIWNTVPALMTMLAAHCEGRALVLDRLRLIMLSGDWIAPSLLPRLAHVAPSARAFSLGGATEASIWSIIHRISQDDARLPSIPYGRPLLNQTIHILDETLAERPDHVEGDIYIGGVGLAEGYLHDAERTAESFIADPQTGARLYRTGDRGRRRPDGIVEFLGRRDTQFKRQGFRIEAGEVEAALRDAGGVKEVVVEAVGDRFDAKRLVAFVVPSRSKPATSKPYRPVIRTFDRTVRRIAFEHPPDVEAMERANGRRSARGFEQQAVALADLTRVLTPLRYVDTGEGRKFRYPSASGLYPVQVYLLVGSNGVTGLDGGLYYVDPSGSLVMLSVDIVPTKEHHVPHNRDLASESAFTLLLFAHMPAIAPSYGALARDLCLLEAGYIGQALMEAAVDTPCELCPIGAMAYGTIAAAAGLRAGDEFLHAFVGGARATHATADIDSRTENYAGDSVNNLAHRLRNHAAERLPAYMLPSDIVVVDRLPLSANGKVDRAALRELASAGSHDAPAPQPPTTDVERRLAEMAARLLDLETVDIDREFFALGADSVKLVEFSAAIEKEFGQSFQVVDAFAHPTIRKMAARLAAMGATNEGKDPLVHMARRRAASRRHTRPPTDADRSDA